MKHVKTIAACAVVALGVGATSATAASMIDGGDIKNGTVAMRDLTPGVQALIKKHAKDGVNGLNGAAGANGKNGAAGANGKDGAAGANANGKDGAAGANGKDGTNGRDGVRWERVTGTCTTGVAGEVMVRDDALKLGLPAIKGPYAQFKMPAENLSLADVDALSFRLKVDGSSNVYMKLKLEGDRFVVFQPGAQTTVPSNEWTKYDVAGEGSKLRDNNDSGTTETFSLEQLRAMHGDLTVKSLEITAGCAGGANDGAVWVDDVTLNDTVIGFQ